MLFIDEVSVDTTKLSVGNFNLALFIRLDEKRTKTPTVS